MVMPQIDSTAPALHGRNVYTGWFLTFGVDDETLRKELAINGTPETSPRLMLIRLGDKGAFKVSPVTGKVLGVELFGVRLQSSEILREQPPRTRNQAAMTIPLKLPYHPIIFEQANGEVESREAGFRHIGYKVATTRSADRFRVQLFRAGDVDRYFRISNSLIVGLDEEDVLAELWFEDVEPARVPDLPIG